MKGISVLILVTSLFANVRCENVTGFGYEILLSEIDNLKLIQSTLEQQLQQSAHQTSTLQTELQNKSATLIKLQNQMSEFIQTSIKMEEKHQIQNDKLLQEIEQLKSMHTSLHQQQEQSKQQTSTLQNQLSVLQKQPDTKWVSWSASEAIPKNAILAGYNWDNAPIYVGRTRHNGDDTIVKVCPTTRSAFLSYAGEEISVHNCEVLTGSGFSWKWGSNGNVPVGAYSCGKHKNGVRHYIGRVHHYSNSLSSLTPGTINGVNGGLYIAFGWKEYKYTNYQVLVHD